ncbi:hypothetical protein D8674_013106 [Pyrus ussuriensis x Pyrus communis]|uniref:Uncharacterized protein n=1 Tax=Pyrus ussuriensis x Pyrus communis TaxID=2448454 RepID=A0A5N5GQ13_9ROSA|nr:hypothetical protein D8674_013106 [Pyrus ussuriensis x Pyrus communis]
MEDKNKDQSMTDADPNDLRQHFQFAHAIAIAIVPEELKKSMLRELSVRGSNFLANDVFSDVYIRPRDELAESLHEMMMEKRQLVLQESTSQLPPDTPL